MGQGDNKEKYCEEIDNGNLPNKIDNGSGPNINGYGTGYANPYGHL